MAEEEYTGITPAILLFANNFSFSHSIIFSPFCWFISISIKTSSIIFLSCYFSFLKNKKQKASSWLHISLQYHFPTSPYSKTLKKLSILCQHALSSHSHLNSHRSHFYPHNSTDGILFKVTKDAAIPISYGQIWTWPIKSIWQLIISFFFFKITNGY